MQDEKYEQTNVFEIEERQTIKGYPELRWTGKRPFRSTQYFPAQLKEVFGVADDNGWLNKIYWGDNLQVMSHLLKDFRGKVDLIYIDPPFDSKADYNKKITIKDKKAVGDSSVFEEKQYSDIWVNDEYLQFMYERILLLRELLSDTGSLYIHLDYHKVHHVKCILDEIFGSENFQREIIWQLSGVSGYKSLVDNYVRGHDTILYYSKSKNLKFNKEYLPYSPEQLRRFSSIDKDGRRYKSITKERVLYLDETKGIPVSDVWTDIASFQTIVNSPEIQNYPTQKPEALVDRIIKASTDEGDLVFDCFMGSGTTQVSAQKLGRKFLGADINLGAIQTTTKRLNKLLSDKDLLSGNVTGFEIYNVNNYDFFRNPQEARSLLIEALNIQPFSQKRVFDGELEGRNVKIMPVNRIATKADLKELIANLPYSVYDRKKTENPNLPVDSITLVCMGHEPDLTAAFKQEVSSYRIDIEIVDILSDKKEFEFKREAKADAVFNEGELIIQSFYPMNLMQKLSLQKEHVDEYRQLVESIMIDWYYDGKVFKPTTIDIPEKNEYVIGTYRAPADHGIIRVKITDLLSESLELEVA